MFWVSAPDEVERGGGNDGARTYNWVQERRNLLADAFGGIEKHGNGNQGWR